MRLTQLIAPLLAALTVLAPTLAPAQTVPLRPLVNNTVNGGTATQQIPNGKTLLLPAPTTANASLNLPHGTAPTSPNNGDVWTTSAGVYVRVNGTTIGPLGASFAPGGSSGQIQYNNGGVFGGFTLGGDCTFSVPNITCTKTSGTSFGYFATGTDAANLTGRLPSLANLPQIGGNSYLGNTSTTTGNVTAYVIPDCHSAATALQYTQSGAVGITCGTITAVAGGTNPFAVGGANIKSAIGAPSSSSDPIGSIYMRTDVSQLWGQIVPSSTVPAVVQAASATTTFTVTFGATPASGDILIAACVVTAGAIPTVSSGWTDTGVSFAAGGSQDALRVAYKFAVTGESTSQTPCSSGGTISPAVMIYEVSGVTNWTASLETSVTQFPSPVSYVTTNANDLVLGFYASPSNTAVTQSGFTLGLSSASGTGTGVATAAQTFASSGSTAGSSWSIGKAEFIVLKPATPGWRQFGWLSTLKQSGTAFSNAPLSLNFSTCLTATDDGLGNFTLVDSCAGTVTHTGSALTAGRLVIGNGTADTTIGLTDVTTDNVTSSAHGLAPKSPADATKFLNGATTPAYAQVKDSDLSTSDITTNDVSNTKHGFAPKLPNDATKYLDGTGLYSTVTATLAAIAADSVLANFTGSSAAPIATAMPSCSGSNEALTYNTTSHAIGCHAPSGAGGGTVTSVTCGTVTITASGTCAAAMNPNRLVNGAMEIDQANEAASVSVATTTSPYITDQWQVPFTGAATGLTAQQVADAPQGFLNSLKVTIGTGSATLNAGDSLSIQQNIEGMNVDDLNFGGANAQAVSLSFWVKSNITGTFGWSIRNSADNRSYMGVFTISAANTWQQVTVAGIAGDTSGTWLTAQGVVGLRFSVTLMAGSTAQGTAGAWTGSKLLTTNAQTNLAATSSNNFQLTGVKVEQSSVVTPYLRRHFTEELLICQRYFEKTYPPGVAIGTLNYFNDEVDGYMSLAVTNGATIAVPYVYKVTKAKAPTTTTYRPRAANASNTIDANGASKASTSTFSGQNSIGGPLNNSGATLTTGQLIEYHVVIDARL